jgi:acylphosphatase
MARVRKRLIVRGWVHGVFFRATFMEKAIANNVKGWVRNNSDGTVEGVCEGEEENVARVVKWCHRGPSGAVVEDVGVQDEPYTGEFTSFSIKYERW